MTQTESLFAYFTRKRAEYVAEYRAARFWNDRKSARRWVLHYGSLCRKLRAHP